MLFQGRIPPFDPGPTPAERDARRRFNLPDPVSKIRCVMDDERGAVLGEDVFEEPVKEQGCVHFPHRFRVVPGRRVNETVIRPLISPIEEVAPE